MTTTASLDYQRKEAQLEKGQKVLPYLGRAVVLDQKWMEIHSPQEQDDFRNKYGAKVFADVVFARETKTFLERLFHGRTMVDDKSPVLRTLDELAQVLHLSSVTSSLDEARFLVPEFDGCGFELPFCNKNLVITRVGDDFQRRQIYRLEKIDRYDNPLNEF